MKKTTQKKHNYLELISLFSTCHRLCLELNILEAKEFLPDSAEDYFEEIAYFTINNINYVLKLRD